MNKSLKLTRIGMLVASLVYCSSHHVIQAQQPADANAASKQVAKRGQISSKEMIITWSLDKGEAAAISTQLGGNWVRIRLAAKTITEPQVADKVAAFYSGNMLYAFSARTGTWDVTKLNQQIGFSIESDSIVVKTDDDLHVFSSAAGRWFSRSKSALTRPASVAPASNNTATGPDPFGGNNSQTPFADPFGSDARPTPADDPFGTGDPASNDPFGGNSQTPFADPFGSDAEAGDAASNDPFGGTSGALSGDGSTADPFGDVNPNAGPFGGNASPSKDDDPFSAPPASGHNPFGAAPTKDDDPFAEDSAQAERRLEQRKDILNKIWKTHHQLEIEIRKRAGLYANEQDPKARERLENEITAMVVKSFDTRLLIQRGELALLQEKIRTAAAKVNARNSQRESYVRNRVKQLTNNSGVNANKQ